jgi:amphi-Trp domain-containing protein
MIGRMARKRERDVEKAYPLQQFVAKLRRLADDLEARKRFAIQIAGERIVIPADAVVNIEHEREGTEEELEFQIKWKAGAVSVSAAGRKRSRDGRVKR